MKLVKFLFLLKAGFAGKQKSLVLERSTQKMVFLRESVVVFNIHYIARQLRMCTKTTFFK